MDISFQTVVTDDPRIEEAFGSILGLGRDATEQEVTDTVMRWVGSQTQDYERRKAQAQFAPPPFETEVQADKAKG
jgi:hypothetical protein